MCSWYQILKNREEEKKRGPEEKTPEGKKWRWGLKGFKQEKETREQDNRQGNPDKTGMKIDGMDSEAHERLEEESQCSQHTHSHKNPEENPVDDHGDVFPVILHLWRWERMDVVGKIPRSVTPSKRDDISKHTPSYLEEPFPVSRC